MARVFSVEVLLCSGACREGHVIRQEFRGDILQDELKEAAGMIHEFAEAVLQGPPWTGYMCTVSIVVNCVPALLTEERSIP